LLSKLQLGF